MVFVKIKNARADRVRMVKWVILTLPKHMYCKQEPDETLIIIKSEWTPQLRDKSLLRTERRSCNSNLRLIQVYLRASTECQSLDCDD